MLRSTDLVWGLLVACVLGLGVSARAANEGQDELDKATKLKLTASTMKDLDEVVRLCENARLKGLDADNDAFAKNILASTLVQRGLIIGRAVLETGGGSGSWQKMRDFALKDLERAVQLEPQQAEALYYIARLNTVGSGDPKRVASALDALIALTDAEPAVRAKALVMRSDSQADMKKKQADLDEAVRLAPRDPSAVLARALLLGEHGNPDQALAELKKAAELDPDRAAPYEAMAIVLARQKKFDEALVAIDHAREREPNSPYPLVQRAKVHAVRGNLDAALHDLDEAATINRDDPEVLLLRAKIYQERGDMTKAMADVEQVLKSHPGLEAAVQFRIAILAGQKKFDLALDELEKIRRANPKNVGTLLEIGVLHSAAHQDAKAIAVFTDVLHTDPSSFPALRGRAYAYLSIGKHAEAIADFEKAYQQKPDDPELLNNFAWVLATSPIDKLRDGQRSIKLATKACELTEYKAYHILSTLAAGYAETGNFEKAKEFSAKAVGLGSADQKDELEKELKSYQAGKPWRELQTAGPPQPGPKPEKVPPKPAEKPTPAPAGKK